MGKPHKEQFNIQINDISVPVTSPDKPIWHHKGIMKLDYLKYLIEFAPRLLPFLSNRTLTVIRYPHGTGNERFFQKNKPDYAPDYIRTHSQENIDYIVCSDLPSLLWLGNQLALEFHIPFSNAGSNKPSEIVMDLDPPSRDLFSLAVDASLIIKEVCDTLHLTSFIKTSGNKGMQVYLPLPDEFFTYEETKMFTEFLANYLTSKHPEKFTTERLKKNRAGRCYIDYIQHAEGKTIIAPYSPRGNEEALVAAPLYWNEVHKDLRPEQFSVTTMARRLELHGDPFAGFFEAKRSQPFAKVLQTLKDQL